MKKLSCFVFLALLASTVVLAQVDIPLHNWTVPPYTVSSSSGIHTMTDATEPRAFIGLPPCRLLDTRNNIYPLGGGGPFAANEVRSYTLPGSCGLPSGTDAVSLNITVTNTQSNPFGFIKIWPQGGTEPNVSTLNWSTGGVTESNAAIVPLSGGGGITIRSGNAGSDVLLDVNGYFSDTLGTPGNVFRLTNNSGLYTIYTTNLSTGCGAHCGIVGTIESTAGGWAVVGFSFGATGANIGVYGSTDSTSFNTYGVKGVTATSLTTVDSWITAGVRGDGGGAGGYGVMGLAGGFGVLGRYINPSTGVAGNYGNLGTASYGVFASGGYGGTGPKYFVEPHPTDASKVIKYIALEGNEPGTYFRGKGRFQNGLARIHVPEDFRMVTDEEGLSVQITPIGSMASVAVLRADLNEILVQASRNVEFYYTVNGIRRTFKELAGNPIAPAAEEYRPLSADATLPDHLAPLQKQWLIQNGTYTAEGKVNMETAQRMGWDRIWYERDHPEPALRTQSPRKD